MNPRVQSTLVESPSPPSQTDTPKADVVLVVGSAERGVYTPVTFEDAVDAYRIYGSNSDLARGIELALEGARYGAASSQSGLYGQVIGLRVPTGTKASAAVPGAINGSVAIRIEAVAADQDINNWTLSRELNGFRLRTSAADAGLLIPFDQTGNTSGVATTASELADAIMRASIDNTIGQPRLLATASTTPTHWELKLNDSSAIVDQTTPEGLDVVRLAAGTTRSSLQASTESSIYLEPGKANDLHGAGPEIQFDPFAPNTEDSRAYALTVGKAVAVPAGARQVAVNNIAIARFLGKAGLKTLVDLVPTDTRTTKTVVSAASTSDAFYRVRSHMVGRFSGEQVESMTTTFTSGGGDSYQIEWAAPGGVNIFTTGVRLGGDADGVISGMIPLRLYIQPVGATAPQEVRIKPIGASAPGVEYDLEFDGTSKKIKLLLSADNLDALGVGMFDDGLVFVSYDTGTFQLPELSDPAALNSTRALEYAVSAEGIVTFNKPVEHDLVVRPLRLTEYRIGSDLIVRRTSDGDVEFSFYGTGNLPGEGGDKINGMETIIGVSYDRDPSISASSNLRVTFSGGSSGLNATVERKVDALMSALSENISLDHFILVPTDVYADDVITTRDIYTGAKRSKSARVLEVLETYENQVRQTGSSSLVFISAKPMRPTSTFAPYSQSQKLQRFAELTQPKADEPSRLANLLATKSYFEFFLFDAPMRVALGGVTYETDGAAFFAGMRSAIPNDRALYQYRMPSNIVPLYQYNIAGYDMPNALSNARINTWASDRNSYRLADERTAAGVTYDSRGNQILSNFGSGHALITAKKYEMSLEQQLISLIGPIPRGGVGQLKATVEMMVQTTAKKVQGIAKVVLDPAVDVVIKSSGMSSVELLVTPTLEINGELRQITIRVGARTSTDMAAELAAGPVSSL